jgi:hypothetical protein
MTVLVAAAAHAQGSATLRFTIPFNFAAGKATLAAGRYEISQSKPGLISLQSRDGKAGAWMLVDTMVCAGVQSASKLVFHRYGSTYVLSQIWTEGDSCGRQGAVSRRERELAARQKAPDETILVALR